MRTFTIEEIRNYIMSRDSLCDAVFFLSEYNIGKANKSQKEEEEITPYRNEKPKEPDFEEDI